MKMLDVPQSGSQAGTTASRNRFGQYWRTRAMPVNPNSPAQGQARARLAGNAALWRTVTDAARAGWSALGGMLSRTDALGQAYTLTGFDAFVSVNNVLLATGSAVNLVAPALASPAAITSATITTTGGTLALAYTPTPLPAATKLMVFASPQRSAGRNFEADLRLIQVSAAAAASPMNLLAAYTARFGVPVVGNKIFFSLVTAYGGFQSGPLMASVVVTA